jgi:hypothetical protein
MLFVCRLANTPNVCLCPCAVLDHLVIQRMDTSGRTVLGSGTGAGAAKQMFGKDEMAAILRCVIGPIRLRFVHAWWPDLPERTARRPARPALCLLPIMSTLRVLPSHCRFGAEALFKEDDQTVEDKSKALYEDSIDAILARAEVRFPFVPHLEVWSVVLPNHIAP